MARDDERALASFERNAEQRVKNEGESVGPIGRKIVSENTQLLADFIESVRGNKRPTQRKFTQKSLLPNVWDRISPVSSAAVLAEACLAGVLNYGRAPLQDGKKRSLARSEPSNCCTSPDPIGLRPSRVMMVTSL